MTEEEFNKKAKQFATDLTHLIEVHHGEEDFTKMAIQASLEVIASILLCIRDEHGKKEMYKVLDCIVSTLDESVEIEE